MSTLRKTCQVMVTHLPHQRLVAPIAVLWCVVVLTVSCSSAPSPPSAPSPSPAPPTFNIIERNGISQASCQSGEHMVGGGYFFNGLTSVNPVAASFPPDDHTWSTDSGVTAFADCLVSTSAETFVVQIVPSGVVAGTPPAGSLVTAQASCPAGSIATGGGFKENTTKLLIETSAPTQARDGWGVRTHLFEAGQNLTIQAFAVCLSGHFTVVPGGPSTNFSIPPQANTPTQLSCPQGALLSSGGFVTTNPGGSPLANTLASNTYPVNSPASTPSAPSGQTVKAWFLKTQNHAKTSTAGFLELVCIKHT